MPKGVLPNFLVIGAGRCGTSMIYECLKEHPEIYMTDKEEVHFFDREVNYIKGLDYYKTYFQFVKEEKIIGEGTPSYLCHQRTAQRIADNLGFSLKLIISLRNPIDMVYSFYKHSFRKHIYRTFSNFTQAEDDILKRGFYIEHIEGYLQYFPRTDFHIVIFDDLLTRPIEFMQSIYKFLRVKDTDFIPPSLTSYKKRRASIPIRYKNDLLLTLLHRNCLIKSVAKYLQRFPSFCHFLRKIRDPFLMEDFDKISLEHRKILRKIYQPHNQRLYKFLGRDLKWE